MAGAVGPQHRTGYLHLCAAAPGRDEAQVAYEEKNLCSGRVFSGAHVSNSTLVLPPSNGVSPPPTPYPPPPCTYQYQADIPDTRGIGASVASLVERIEISNAEDSTWISAVLSICRYVRVNNFAPFSLLISVISLTF